MGIDSAGFSVQSVGPRDRWQVCAHVAVSSFIFARTNIFLRSIWACGIANQAVLAGCLHASTYTPQPENVGRCQAERTDIDMPTGCRVIRITNGESEGVQARLLPAVA